MSKFQSKDEGKERPDWGNSKRARHLLAIRRNQVSVAEMFLFLAEDPPNASAAKEALDELEHEDATGIWSCSTKDGGVWETWQRDALKYGELTRSWDVWKAENNR